MTQEQLITKQQLEIEEYKQSKADNKKLRKELIGKFYNIGEPLNDNVLEFNKAQQKWCFEVLHLIEQLQ